MKAEWLHIQGIRIVGFERKRRRKNTAVMKYHSCICMAGALSAISVPMSGLISVVIVVAGIAGMIDIAAGIGFHTACGDDLIAVVEFDEFGDRRLVNLFHITASFMTL